MQLGIVMLVHNSFERAAQIARVWSNAGCPLVIHVDAAVLNSDLQSFKNALADLPNLSFSKRYRCEWGTWGLVAATQDACAQLLEKHKHIGHVYLTSGSCLPLRPITELEAYLEEKRDTDFIESVTTEDVHWTMGGLDRERFTLRFPFSWKKNRYLFDKYVQLQRRLKYKRSIPAPLEPHMGSQWWCLTRRTLEKILKDPNRAKYDRYFKRVWIPDESYFQTLSRVHSVKIESRSLTLSKFDFQGKPHIFYDDHLQLLRRSDCFVARKIWPKADRLYEHFLSKQSNKRIKTEPNSGKIDRVFVRAMDRRTRGRPGLYMQSRFPRSGWENGATAQRYTVLEGYAELFEGFETWLAKHTSARIHGHIFHPNGAQFAGGHNFTNGALSSAPALRDLNTRAFLTNLIWNTRGEKQVFQFGPGDTQSISSFMAHDPNAEIHVIAGAWAVPLFESNLDFGHIRKRAAMLQKRQSRHIETLRSPTIKARVRVLTMAEFIEAPTESLMRILVDLGVAPDARPTEMPRLKRLDGFAEFLQRLKNEGMNPYLMGDFPLNAPNKTPKKTVGKPYLVK